MTQKLIALFFLTGMLCASLSFGTLIVKKSSDTYNSSKYDVSLCIPSQHTDFISSTDESYSVAVGTKFKCKAYYILSSDDALNLDVAASTGTYYKNPKTGENRFYLLVTNDNSLPSLTPIDSTVLSYWHESFVGGGVSDHSLVCTPKKQGRGRNTTIDFGGSIVIKEHNIRNGVVVRHVPERTIAVTASLLVEVVAPADEDLSNDQSVVPQTAD